MRKLALTLYMFLLLGGIASSQSIPPDSLYLGQTPPENTPIIFKLPVSLEHFAAERITISDDGKEIYYSEIKAYYPIRGQRIKGYRFSSGKWSNPFNLFEGYMAPAFSVTGDVMYFENGTSQTYFSTKQGLSWSSPRRMLARVDTAHYLQVTNKGNYYVSARTKSNVGMSDWCKLEVKGADTSAVSLGMPLNTVWDNLDFFIPRDESFMIAATSRGLGISYHKKDGSWTNPRNLGQKINFGLGMWGPFVTSDNKYLFYTTGTKPDYSDVNVYWVRIDGLIDSLKNTNIPPYLKNNLKTQSALVGNPFNFTVADDTFFDEDSNNPFTYSATLLNGSPLPAWLSFNPSTRTFSGTPKEEGTTNVKVVATDSAKGSAACLLTIQIAPSRK